MHGNLTVAADRFGERDAVRAGDASWSFRDLDELSNAFARHLSGPGVGAGDRVAVMMANRVEFITTVYAISKLGAASVLLSPAWKSTEVGHALELTGPVHAVADADAAALLAEILGAVSVTDLDDAARDPFALQPRPAPIRMPPAGPPRPSSSSARARPGSPRPCATRMTPSAMRPSTGARSSASDPMTAFRSRRPPSHILGLLNLLTAVAAGATVRLHRRFDLDEVLQRIASERMTLEMAVAPIALAMANHPRLEEYDLSSLRYIMWGATPVTESVARIVTERTGVRWLPAYGASELPVITANPVDRPESWRLDSAGLPPSGVELRIADLESGKVLDSGEIGEIQVLSPSVMAGYLPDEATAEAFADGWYRTGDVGWLEPEGWVHLTDRSKEMIKVSGFQVAPAEVEAVLYRHPAVLDCAVFGVADARSGEVPMAAVKVDPDQPLADGELERLVAESLATYKQLRRVVIVDEIPRLPVRQGVAPHAA